MSKLDTVLARIRQLPPEEQEALAVEIQFLLDHPVESGFTLTDEQWAQGRHSGQHLCAEQHIAASEHFAAAGGA